MGLKHCEDDWEQLCRLCAGGNKTMVPIFGEEGKRMALAYKINKHLPFTVSPENKLPLNVCQDCISELNASMNFVRKCMENQIKLRKMMHLSVEDCNYETEDTVETRYLSNTSKKWMPIISNVVSEQSNEKEGSLKSTSEATVLNDDQTYLNDGKEMYENEEENCTINHNAEHVDIGSQEINMFSSNEDGHKVFVEIKGIENTPHETESLEVEPGEEHVSNEVYSESVNEENSDLRQFCRFCNAGFQWKAELFDHQTEVHPDLVFRCCYCMKVFYNKEEFHLHELAHRKFMPAFKGKLSLKKHMRGNLAKSNSSNGKSYSNSVSEDKLQEVTINKSGCLSTNGDVNNMRKSTETNGKIPSGSLSNEKRKEENQILGACFSCDYCPRKFRSKLGQKKHEAIHQQGKKISFQCNICLAVFASYHLLKKHELSHSGGDKYQCEICLKYFDGKNEVEEHVQTHAGESSYLCELCGLNVESFVLFRLHRMDHLQSDFYKCNHCQKSFLYASSLKNHQLVHHKKKVFPCKVCKNSFSTADLLKEHKLIHEKEILVCDVCHKSFTGYRKLKNHVQTHTEGGRNYLCEKCGKDFKSNSSLHKHRYLCQVAIACPVCGKEFDCNTRLKVHLRVHTGEKPFVCSVCGKGFHASWSLSQHSRTHNTVKIPCPLCGALFNRKSNMLAHKERHRVPCGICGKVFASIPILLDHQKTHEADGDKVIETEVPKDDSSVASRCEQCGKLFMTALDLKSHMSTHSSERPYKCDICGKSWRLKKTLKKHMVTHSGRKPYQCRYCPCTFLLHQRLVKHENGHTAGKPFSCQDCGQSFWTQLNLEKHTIKHCAMKIVDEKYACKVCDKTFESKSSLMAHKRTHSHQLTYCCAFCPRKFSQLHTAQRHNCSLDPDNQYRESSDSEYIKSMPSLVEEESCSPDENTCPGILSEVVNDMDTVSPSYAEIIVISQGMADIIVENSNDLDNSS